jgi:hypothetical protein
VIKTIEHPTLEIRNATYNIITTLYEKYGFDVIEPFIARLSSKVLLTLVKKIPESEPYIRINE